LCLRLKLGQVFYHLAGDYKSCDGRDKGIAAGNLTAVGAFAGCAGRANAVGAAGYAHIVNRGHGRFLGLDHL
jgi:hypothetical protein